MSRRDIPHGEFRLYPQWKTLREEGMCAHLGCQVMLDDDPWLIEVPAWRGEKAFTVSACSQECSENWRAAYLAQFSRRERPKRKPRRKSKKVFSLLHPGDSLLDWRNPEHVRVAWQMWKKAGQEYRRLFA